MKNLLILSIILSIGHNIMAQLKILPNGNIGVGTNSPIGKLHVQGSVFLTGSTNTFRILPNNPGTEIGTSTDVIDFWYSTNSHNSVRAASFDRVSDSTLKKEIRPLTNGLDNLMQLKTYSYKILKGAEGKQEYKSEFGFISQEIQKLHPDITSLTKGVLAMDYDQIIPIAVKAIQEQQGIIDSLSAEVSLLKIKLDELRYESEVSSNSSEANINRLEQNQPNPFGTRTIIKYVVSEVNFKSAFMVVFDLNGVLIKQYPIDAGSKELEISQGDLSPGMYIYTLVVNQKEIDTKRMILLNN